MTPNDLRRTVQFIREIFGDGPIPLHRPVFKGNEKRYLLECIDSNFVSSVGARVGEFEQMLSSFTGAHYAVATMNGTASLHAALLLAGVQQGDEVLCQALTFIATCNAVSYCNAIPVFVDVDRDTLGMSPEAVRAFLAQHVVSRDRSAYNRVTGRRIAACVPMHTFGLPLRIREIVSICDDYGIPVVEDAAESLGSYVDGQHTGTFGRLATLSFNGNKIITTGGGGAVLTNDPDLGARAKHLTTTAKVPHPYEFVHDEIGYNYRLPNVNAALGCAQMEALPSLLLEKRELARRYEDFFTCMGVEFIKPLPGTTSNHWLNGIVLPSSAERDEFLQKTNAEGVMTRPIWRLMTHLPMFKSCQHDGLRNSIWLEERVVNVPSSAPDNPLIGIAK